ncbi:MAG: hypothetical protein JOZ12_14080 [Sinobacteraceae bacterium]|nr:hypothetical protein [Nevskiaceae bacterium]
MRQLDATLVALVAPPWHSRQRAMPGIRMSVLCSDFGASPWQETHFSEACAA